MMGGYSNPFTVEQMFERVAGIDGVEGIELVSDWHITAKNVKLVKEQLEKYNFKLASIIPDHFGEMVWGKGAFTSKDKKVRDKAVSDVKEMIDISKELGGNLISLWPGQDGYDYYFTADYMEERGWFEECLKDCCNYDKNFKISVEYKPKEPRNRSYPSNVYSTLLMVRETGCANCGITVDYGHALVAYENVAESVSVLKKYGNKLFHLHMNDSYGYWDDDMIAGSIHTIPYLETIYWLKKNGYEGFVSTDQYPYREDGQKAVAETLEWLKCFEQVADRMLEDQSVEEVIRSGDATQASAMLRSYLFPLC